MHHSTPATQPSKKFCVFHQRHFRKPANIKEHIAPAEYPVIPTPHSKQDACVMCKAIRQSINWVWRQTNTEKAADGSWVIQHSGNFIQTFLRYFCIDVHEPKYVAPRAACAQIHLHGPIGLAPDKLIAKVLGKLRRSIGASPVCDNNFSFRRSLAQMSQKPTYQRRFIKNRNNDRELHSKRATQMFRRCVIFSKAASACLLGLNAEKYPGAN
jgi:hypothetical protein